MSADAYHRWLATAPPRAAIMHGLPGVKLPRAGEALVGAGVANHVRWGGWGEDRNVYTQALFATEGEEPRTVHLGVDIFAPARAEVFAPLDGAVQSFQINDAAGDYGPTIILEHSPAPGLTFWTLYGHLSRDSLDRLRVGQPIAAGERIARLGASHENGGWPPHLHFQIIRDLGGRSGDFPGVCRRSEQAEWLALCPDPTPLLEL